MTHFRTAIGIPVNRYRDFNQESYFLFFITNDYFFFFEMKKNKKQIRLGIVIVIEAECRTLEGYISRNQSSRIYIFFSSYLIDKTEYWIALFIS